MSSHHIVREKQEPALLLLGINSFDGELLGQLLEWSPTVLTTPLVAEQLNVYEIKIDLIIANSLDEELQSDVKLITPGDVTPLECGVNYLIDQGYSAVNVVVDDLDIDYLLPFCAKINLVIYKSDQKIYPVTSGFRKWKPAGETVSLLTEPANLRVSGLTPQAANTYLTSNDGFISLHFESPYLFIAENI